MKAAEILSWLVGLIVRTDTLLNRYVLVTMVFSGNEAIREFMDNITSSTNVSKYVELPMIAVMGDTSSGKSSLLSSISMVELPSSSELTTRCPIMLQMRRSEEQVATVSVAWHETPDGDTQHHFEPRTVEKENWSDLSDTILAAQSHIIKVTGKEVAQDKVHVKLSGPYCEDLTLIDLPGIVRSRGDKEGETIVEDIDALMKDYLSNKRCVILAVVPANVDFHNSQIMADAKRVDPETTRTIPVITKPDLIDGGGENDVKRLLLGEKVEFHHGFHMVKGRGQAALDSSESIKRGLTVEKRFFETSEPWRSITDKNKFGTDNLRRKLGKLQMDMFTSEVPGILKDIKSKRDDAVESLEKMGGPHLTTGERQVFYRTLAHTIVSGLDATLNGAAVSANAPTLTAQIHDACEAFKTRIEEGKLAGLSNLKLAKGDYVKIASKEDIVHGKVVHATEHEIFVDYEDRETRNRPEFIISYKTTCDSGSKTPVGGVWTDGDSVYIARKAGRGDQLKGFPKAKAERDPKWISDSIKKQRTAELPIFPSSIVFNRLVVMYINDDWKPACRELAQDISDIVGMALIETLKNVVSFERYPRLFDLLRLRFDDVEIALRKDAKSRVEEYVKRGTFSYSQNDDMFETITNLQLRGLKQQLRAALDLDSQPNHNVATSTTSTIVDAVFDRNKQVPLDEYMAATMMHGLEAYGDVAKKRFMDEVPVLLWEVVNGTVQAVELSLWKVTDDDLKRVMKDSDEFQRTFKLKTDELKELNAALEIFQKLL